MDLCVFDGEAYTNEEDQILDHEKLDFDENKPIITSWRLSGITFYSIYCWLLYLYFLCVNVFWYYMYCDYYSDSTETQRRNRSNLQSMGHL